LLRRTLVLYIAIQHYIIDLRYASGVAFFRVQFIIQRFRITKLYLNDFKALEWCRIFKY